MLKIDWLSTTWQANWRPFQYFNLYRLIVASVFLLGILLQDDITARLRLLPTPVTLFLTGCYMLVVIVGLLLSIYWRRRFNWQLSLQVIVDIVAVSVVMLSAGGVGSGLALLLLVSLAAASLVGHGRLVLFYAALATLAVLLSQIYGILRLNFAESSVVQAGFISTGFFATAILARLLGQRAMTSETLARRRGVALDNQIRISQRVVEQMQDGVLIIGGDGHISRYNPVAGAMLGFTSQARPAPPPGLAAALAAWLEGGPESFQFVGFSGRSLLARFERTASSDHELLVFLEDLDRIRERAQEMKLAALGRLTASIAHEIRNPLSAISHAGELLHEERRGEVQERLLRIINDNVLRLDRIVQDVLTLGRQNSARPELLSLDEVCPAFIEELTASESLAPGIVVWQPSGGASLCFDRAHLHQLLWNLIGNALRHASRHPAAIRLEAAADGGWVKLHVIDDGPGVADEVREQIFEPFFTTHNAGTGLGLYIGRELCVANGASLSVGANAPGGHFIIAGRNDTCQQETNNGRRDS
ncbi:MAG: HAMP domain-containing histidine kinase [Azonexus sp.]|jgi:two-component system sensor histidine kinase PilS (NtrC family)|nr:HAMP domain-containing histidine kinase [Azonexus sp.]